MRYVEEEKLVHYCANSGRKGFGLHYVFDPTGWGIQLDIGAGPTSDCKSSLLSQGGRRLVQRGGNPACSVGICGDSSKSWFCFVGERCNCTELIGHVCQKTVVILIVILVGFCACCVKWFGFTPGADNEQSASSAHTDPLLDTNEHGYSRLEHGTKQEAKAQR